MAEWFLKKYDAFVMNDELYLYKDGVYTKGEWVFEVECTKALGVEFHTSRMRETLEFIKISVPRVIQDETVDFGMVLNVKNGLLNLETLEMKPHIRISRPLFRSMRLMILMLTAQRSTVVTTEK